MHYTSMYLLVLSVRWRKLFKMARQLASYQEGMVLNKYWWKHQCKCAIHISSKECAQTYDTSALQIIRKDNLKLYHRLHFCEIMTNMLRANPNLLNQIVFSDEATFCLHNNVNRHIVVIVQDKVHVECKKFIPNIPRKWAYRLVLVENREI